MVFSNAPKTIHVKTEDLYEVGNVVTAINSTVAHKTDLVFPFYIVYLPE
jgi:hypothetical protein